MKSKSSAQRRGEGKATDSAETCETSRLDADSVFVRKVLSDFDSLDISAVVRHVALAYDVVAGYVSYGAITDR